MKTAMRLMDHNVAVDGNTKAGTVGGTLLILFINLSSAEVLKTVILAAIGALVSFSVSMMLKIIVKRIRKK